MGNLFISNLSYESTTGKDMLIRNNADVIVSFMVSNEDTIRCQLTKTSFKRNFILKNFLRFGDFTAYKSLLDNKYPPNNSIYGKVKSNKISRNFSLGIKKYTIGNLNYQTLKMDKNRIGLTYENKSYVIVLVIGNNLKYLSMVDESYLI
jgi:hypothetical protein